MLQKAWLLATTVEGMALRSWLTTSLSAYRVSVAGLNNSSGRLAIWARRMRRATLPSCRKTWVHRQLQVVLLLQAALR